ncbi:MAG: hypothetical protein JOZ43_06495 [Acidobacteriales bacterium]|nr:hypothetical protein [Terriglobales bacterium]
MEIEFSPEHERRLQELAARLGMSPAKLVAAWIRQHIEHDDPLHGEIEKGLASLRWSDAMRREDARRRAEEVVRGLWSFTGSRQVDS